MYLWWRCIYRQLKINVIKKPEDLYNNFNLSNLRQSISKLEQIENNNNIKIYYKQNVILLIEYN